jgi:hypothetical protein
VAARGWVRCSRATCHAAALRPRSRCRPPRRCLLRPGFGAAVQPRGSPLQRPRPIMQPLPPRRHLPASRSRWPQQRLRNLQRCCPAAQAPRVASYPTRPLRATPSPSCGRPRPIGRCAGTWLGGLRAGGAPPRRQHEELHGWLHGAAAARRREAEPCYIIPNQSTATDSCARHDPNAGPAAAKARALEKGPSRRDPRSRAPGPAAAPCCEQRRAARAARRGRWRCVRRGRVRRHARAAARARAAAAGVESRGGRAAACGGAHPGVEQQPRRDAGGRAASRASRSSARGAPPRSGGPPAAEMQWARCRSGVQAAGWCAQARPPPLKPISELGSWAVPRCRHAHGPVAGGRFCGAPTILCCVPRARRWWWMPAC